MSTSELHIDSDQETIDTLLAEFNETLRSTGKADYASALKCCPAHLHKELQSLMNIAAMAYDAFRWARAQKNSGKSRKAVG